MDRLGQQIRFIVEIDKLKQVFRQSALIGDRRKENDAEHSWHLAAMAMLLTEYVKEEGVNLFRVIKMLLIHDLVEIDAGDTLPMMRKEMKIRKKGKCRLQSASSASCLLIRLMKFEAVAEFEEKRPESPLCSQYRQAAAPAFELSYGRLYLENAGRQQESL